MVGCLHSLALVVLCVGQQLLVTWLLIDLKESLGAHILLVSWMTGVRLKTPQGGGLALGLLPHPQPRMGLPFGPSFFSCNGPFWEVRSHNISMRDPNLFV